MCRLRFLGEVICPFLSMYEIDLGMSRFMVPWPTVWFTPPLLIHQEKIIFNTTNDVHSFFIAVRICVYFPVLLSIKDFLRFLWPCSSVRALSAKKGKPYACSFLLHLFFHRLGFCI